MREIRADQISEAVARLFVEANYHLPVDVLEALKKAASTEESSVGKEVLQQIVQNAGIAENEKTPLCQDCGTAVIFIEIGQDVHVVGGDLEYSVNEGVKKAYAQGYLRKSIVSHPFSTRTNTGDNTPAVVHTRIIGGDRLRITAVPKGGGAENMSRLGMLTPADGRRGVVDFVVSTVEEAGSNPCPPLVVGVGIGGTAEETILLAKQALLREIGKHNNDPEVASLEVDILKRVNNLGIGPMGYGGRNTALAVNIEVVPCHLASMPVAVNLNCHCSRHKTVII